MMLSFFILWVVFSGNLSLETFIWATLVSVVLDCFCRRVLGYQGGLGLLRHPVARVQYLGYLLIEMCKAALVVMRLVYTKGKDMEPRLVYFDDPTIQERNRVLLANSITLTAGTIAVETEGGRFCVHALDKSLVENMAECGFSQRIKNMEASPWNK